MDTNLVVQALAALAHPVRLEAFRALVVAGPGGLAQKALAEAVGVGPTNLAFHLKELSELFVQVVRLAREMGLVKLGTIAVDGTKLKANASRHKAMSYSHMLKAEAELKAQIDALLKRAQQADGDRGLARA